MLRMTMIVLTDIRMTRTRGANRDQNDNDKRG